MKVPTLFRALPAVLTSALCLSAAMAEADTRRVAIANFGEHPKLNEVVENAQAAITAAGLDVEFTVNHVNFDATLLPQMFATIEATDPDLIIGITTPVAQTMLNTFGESGKPMIFGAVTDPVGAELVPSWDQAGAHITGVSDMLDIAATLTFIQELFPDTKTVGVPYNPAEANDIAVVKILEEDTEKAGLSLASVGVDNPNDIIARISTLSAKADVIYGPGSNLIQSSFAAVASAANQTNTPVVNMDEGPVIDGLIPAGFTVNTKRIGTMVGEMAVEVLNGTDVSTIAPRKPTYEDHWKVISRSGMANIGREIPASFETCNCIVD
ncbi:ABC transporter substrate-binding protein [Arenibacterium sp. LLYu02]|uniref:ABC transporter substrate-binding protein n=1 Tax=Arenibacterium sp. LLYu02 TaxID=3404132 RepID=UPI003B227FC9